MVLHLENDNITNNFDLSVTLNTNVLPEGENPSCLQATVASKVDQKSSHTVPQTSFQQISTRPSYGVVPPTSLMSPSSQTPGGNIVSLSSYIYKWV